MNVIKTKRLLLPTLLVSALITTGFANADPKNVNNNWYIGGSIGQSNLNPDENNTNWDVTDKNDVSKKVYVGKNFNDRLAMEAFWTDLGAAGLSSSSGSNGKIDYDGIGANVVYKLPYQIGKLKPFAKLGVGKFKTTDKLSVTSKQLNKTSVIGALGMDYEISDQLDLRTEFDYYDKDAQDLNVGLKWTPGYRSHRHNRVKPVAKKIVRPVPPPKPKVIYKQAKPKVVYREAKPKVVYVPKKVIVKQPAKPQYQVMHRNLSGGSNFDTNSAQLTYMGQNVLTRLVNDIKNQRVAVKSIDVVGHTDSVGTNQSNYYLSVNRANSVADFLASRGMNRSLIRTEGRGETQPIADNRNKFGRAKNRRVEITVNGTSRELVRR